jgi:hypothetical protein
LPNPRIRGKIARHEWPEIVARFHNGETLTKIARSYHCTPPAIRYILARISSHAAMGEMGGSRPERLAVLVSSTQKRRLLSRAPNSQSFAYRTQARSNAGPAAELWSRINSDIATFLAALDSLSSDDSDNSYEAVLAATDRLLRGSARARLELERILDNRERATASAPSEGSVQPSRRWFRG